ncbi:MAG TPA: ABC transporter permease [Streptosporangiaceae bacterium]|nr:ABC transporter permease [Streptosporangiaceae bacterium]
MNRSWWRTTRVIAGRELRTRGRSRAFAVTTAILLIAVAAAVVIPALLAGKSKPSRVGVVGANPASMTTIVTEAGKVTGTKVTVMPEPDSASAEAALRDGSLDIVLVDGSEVLIKQVPVGGSSSGGSLPNAIASIAGLTKALPPGSLAGGPQLALPVRGLIPPGASLTRRLTGLFTSIVLWILISTYGQVIANGVAEEKQNRIVEVILATVRPIQLLTGKVLGMGLLSLMQAAGVVLVFLGLGSAVGSSVVHGAAGGIVVAGAVFMVLGYAFYCTAYAAAGSMVSRQSEIAATVVPVGIPLIVAYALSYTVLYANNANAFYRFLGFLPPTSPIAMPVLYAAGDVPLWQVIVSAALLAAGTLVMARIAALVYSRSILRTGARLRLRQVLRG